MCNATFISPFLLAHILSEKLYHLDRITDLSSQGIGPFVKIIDHHSQSNTYIAISYSNKNSCGMNAGLQFPWKCIICLLNSCTKYYIIELSYRNRKKKQVKILRFTCKSRVGIFNLFRFII